MQTETLILLAAATFLFVLYTTVLQPTLFSPLARIPTAHWSCSLSNYWILRARKQAKENETLFKAHLRHGPIVRVAPNTLSVDGVDAMRAIYQGGYEKSDWYRVFDNYGCVGDLAMRVPCINTPQRPAHVLYSGVQGTLAQKTNDFQCLLQVLYPRVSAGSSPEQSYSAGQARPAAETRGRNTRRQRHRSTVHLDGDNNGPHLVVYFWIGKWYQFHRGHVVPRPLAATVSFAAPSSLLASGTSQPDEAM